MKSIIQDGIEWEIEYDNLLDVDPDEHLKTYVAHGWDKSGRYEYQGTAYLYDDELDEIKDIEEI